MRTTTSADGTTIAYEVVGEGPPLVLIGGAFNDRRSPSAGLPLAEHLADDHAVVCYDRRGRGDSGDILPYAPAREIEDLAAVIAAAGGPAAVFGHSSGAALALRAAAAGVPMTSLVLFEPPFTAATPADAAFDALREELDALLGDGRRGDAVETFQLAIGMPSDLVVALRDAPFRAGLEAIAHTLPYDLAVIGPGTLPVEVAAAVTVPTLVVVGADSPGELVAAGRALAGAVRGGRLAVLEGVDHSAPPEALAAPITPFLAAA
jgi:pimeloyl-ACP methyl ester carboxylesterase